MTKTEGLTSKDPIDWQRKKAWHHHNRSHRLSEKETLALTQKIHRLAEKETLAPTQKIHRLAENTS